MAAAYRIYREPSYLNIFLSGQVTAQDYFQLFEELLEDEAFYPAIPTLMEVGEAAEIAVEEVNTEVVDTMVELVGQARGDAHYRIATAGGPPDTRAFIVMAQELTDSRPDAKVFESLDEARQWLLS